jgi:hypothetical protein
MLRKSIEVLLDEMDGKLSGYAAMLNYRYMNLCVEAEPAALVPITVTDIEGNVYNIEEVADCMQPNQFAFEIVPRRMPMLPFIQKGIAESHPEFKQEVIIPKDEDRFFMSGTVDYDSERHILCTMPEVDDERYKLLTETVKALYDECMVEVDKIKTKYTQMLADRSKDLPEDEADEAKTEQEKLLNLYSETIKNYRDNKEKEIEEAHNTWLADEAEKHLKQMREKRG